MNSKVMMAALAVAAAFFTQFAAGQDCAMIPADAQGAGRVDVKELNANPLFQKLRAQAESSQWAKGMKSLQIDEKSITKMLFYVREKGQKSAFICFGTFDIDQAKKALSANAVQSDGFIAYKDVGGNGATGYIAFPQAGMFIASEKISELKYLASVIGKQKPSLQPKSKLDSALRSSAVVAAGFDKALFGEADNEAPEFIAVAVTKQAPSNLKAAVAMTFADAETPAKYEQQANGMKAMFAMMAMQDEKSKNSGLPELLQAVNIKAEGKKLNGSLLITESVVKTVAELAKDGALKGGMVPGIPFPDVGE